MDTIRPRVVFDCNIFLQAISRPNGPAARALRMVESNNFTLYLSRPIIRELTRTLAYPEIREKNPHITDELVNSYVQSLRFRGVLIREIKHVFDYPRDPKDEPYIDLAAAIGADYIVTRDKDLLSLATNYSTIAKQFRQRFPSLQVVDPVNFLAQLNPRPPMP